MRRPPLAPWTAGGLLACPGSGLLGALASGDAHLAGDIFECGDAVLGRWMGGEEIVHAISGQRVDDEEVSGRRVLLRRLVLDMLRGALDASQCRGKRQRLAGDLSPAAV